MNIHNWGIGNMISGRMISGRMDFDAGCRMEDLT